MGGCNEGWMSLPFSNDGDDGVQFTIVEKEVSKDALTALTDPDNVQFELIIDEDVNEK
jgi:hypothetical protein